MNKIFYIIFFLTILNLNLVFSGITGYINQEGYSVFDKGKFYQTQLSSDGIISISNSCSIISNIKYDVVWDVQENREGELLLFTGFNGIISNLTANREYKTELNSVKTTFLDSNGDIYCAGLGNKIYKISGDTISEFVTLNDSYVWCIEKFDEENLIICTGLKANIYKISKQSKIIDIIGKTDFDNILCLKKNGDDIIFGTSNSGNVYKLNKNKISILLNLPGKEIVSLELSDNKTLYIAANKKQKGGAVFPQPVSDKKEVPRREQKEFGDEQDFDSNKEDNEFITDDDDDEIKKAETVVTKKSEKVQRGELDKSQIWELKGNEGKVFKYRFNGQLEEIYSSNKGYIYSMLYTGSNNLVIAVGNENKLVNINTETLKYSDILKIQGKDFITLKKPDKKDYFYAVSKQPVNIYKINSALADTGEYISDIINFNYPAIYGKISIIPSLNFDNLKFEFRNGFSESPDSYWSNWTTDITSLEMTNYLQYKIFFKKDKFSESSPEIKKIIIPYLKINQRPVIKYFNIDGIKEAKDDSAKRGLKKPSKKFSERTAEKNDSINFNWQVEDSNNDILTFNLYYKNLYTNLWVKMNDKPLKDEDFSLNTKYLEDGWYIFKLEVSDELSNNKEEFLYTTQISDVLLIDNTQPEFFIDKFEIKEGTLICSAKIKDNYSIIKEQYYKIDNEEWKFIKPENLINDSKEENLKIKIDNLISGIHSITFKFLDMAENEGFFTKEFICE